MAQSYDIVSRRGVTTLSWHRVTTLCQGAKLRDCVVAQSCDIVMAQSYDIVPLHRVATLCHGTELPHCHGTELDIVMAQGYDMCHGTELRHCVMAQSYDIVPRHSYDIVSRRSVTTLSRRRVTALFPATDDNHDTQRTTSCQSELECNQWLWHYSILTCSTPSLYTIAITLNRPLLVLSFHTSFGLYSAIIRSIIHT